MNKKNVLLAFAPLLVLFFSCQNLSAQHRECFVGWTFDVSQTPQYWNRMTYAPTVGYYHDAMLYADGTHGSSQFVTLSGIDNYPQMLVNGWVGTTLGDPRPAPYDGYCLGFKHPNSANRSFVLATPTTYYHKLALKFAVTRSNTGFRQMNFTYSLDGSTYQQLDARAIPDNQTDFEMVEIDMSLFPQLENQPMVYLRVTISNISSTAYSGNIKFDNICFYGDKCVDTTVIHDTAYCGSPYIANGFFLPEITEEGDFVYENITHIADGCDSMCALHLNVIDTTPPVIPEDTTHPTDTTAIAQWMSVESLSLFPNPASDVLRMNYAGKSPISSIIIYNEMGMKVYEVIVPAAESRISEWSFAIADWKKGTYFLYLQTTDNQRISKKFIKW